MTDNLEKQRILFTEEENAIDCLEKARYFLALTRQNPINWKWAILALHGALYSFAICALKGVNISTKWNIDDSDAIYMKNGKLITLDEAIRKCQKPKLMEGFIDSKPLCLTGTQWQSVKEMKEMRNDFVHYIPKIWIISTENLHRIANNVLDVISFLAINTQANIHVLNEKEKIENLVNACKLVLEKQ